MSPAELGERFAKAVAAKDQGELTEILKPEINFRAMTPGTFWESSSAAEVVKDIICGKWFEPSDHIVSSEITGTATIADCHRVGYCFRVSNSQGSYIVEQQAYYCVEDKQINWLRIMCSGFRVVS